MMIEEMQIAVPYKPELQSGKFGIVNPLLEAASQLILFFIQLRNTHTPIDPHYLRKIIVTEVDIFVNQAKAAQCPTSLILAAQYCLCTALDETILLTPWGPQSDWGQKSLLSHIHHETWGGERFFIILEKMAEEPKKNLWLLELLYQLLALGFEGKYYNENRMLREDLHSRLYQLIIRNHAELTQYLSPGLYTLRDNQSPKIKKIYYLRFFAGTFGALLSIGLIFNTMLYWKSKPFLQELRDISMAHSSFISPVILPKLPHKNKTNYHRRIKHYHYDYPNKNRDNIILPPPAWGGQS